MLTCIVFFSVKKHKYKGFTCQSILQSFVLVYACVHICVSALSGQYGYKSIM